MINYLKRPGTKIITGLFYLAVSGMCFLASCKTIQPTSKPAPQKPVVTKPDPPADTVATTPKKIKSNEIVKMRFAFIMPFELEQNFDKNTDDKSEPEISPNSLNALNFYEGAVLAVDSLKTNKVELKLSSFDTPSDSSGVVRMMTNAVIKEADAVFATLPNHLAPVAARVAKLHNIRLILTQASSPDILYDNPNVALAFASTKTQCREMVGYMIEKHPGANIILVYRTVKREDELAEVFRQEIIARNDSFKFKDFNASKKEYTEVSGLLDSTKRNLVFLISSDEAFVNPVLALMEEQNIFGIKVSGLPTWLNFESIDFMTFKNLHIHLFDNNFIEQDLATKAPFRKSFINRFHIDPLTSAYNGFEMVYNIGLTLREEYLGMDQLMKSAFAGNGNNYNFADTTSGGIENKVISVLKIADYKLERMNK